MTEDNKQIPSSVKVWQFSPEKKNHNWGKLAKGDFGRVAREYIM